MRYQVKLLLFTCLSALAFLSCESLHHIGKAGQQQDLSDRTIQNFGFDWEFQRLQDSIPSREDWETINIPHTTKIEPLLVNDQWQGTSLYRKTFKVDSLKDQKWFFHFEAVMQEARVSINDSLVAIHKGGYLPFTIDATPHLNEKETNRIEVRVINVDDPVIPPGKPLNDLDFNYYGGIYRNVHLIKTNPVHITDAVHAGQVNSGGLLIHFDDIRNLEARGFIKTHVRNDSEEKIEVRLRTTFIAPDGERKAFLSELRSVRAYDDISFHQDLMLDNPHLWSPANPNLYNVKVEVLAGGEVIDHQEIKTGIREIRLEGDTFYLNGEEIFLNGTNRHQEYPYVGYAISDEARYRDAYKIKDAGFNFVRLSHYPQSTAFLEACDELGLLVMNAIPGWQFFEEGEFEENAFQDIKDMVRRDRNHPSVVFWENSLNESEMTEEFMKKANEILKAELPYEDTYSAGWVDHPSYDLFIPARQHAEAPHYWNRYDKTNRPLLIAEYGDWEYYAHNAGFNQSAFSDLQEEERTSRQLRSAGEKGLLQQALNYQEAFNSNLKGKQTIGQANWLMFDYNRGYSNNLEASGISDIFRIPKFSYYFFKSQKPPNTGNFSKPMVYIANHWTSASTTKVKVFSNTEEVAFYLNGVLIDRKKPKINEISDELPYPPFVFELAAFQPGVIRAVGYIGGEEVASHKVRTPSVAAKLDIAIDRSGKSIATENPDVVFLYVIIRDAKGTAVPGADNQVEFTIVEGHQNARLIGDTTVNAEAGIATILLRTESLSGPVVVRASSEELGETEITIMP